jgi:hypothetical protein
VAGLQKAYQERKAAHDARAKELGKHKKELETSNAPKVRLQQQIEEIKKRVFACAAAPCALLWVVVSDPGPQLRNFLSWSAFSPLICAPRVSH